jgi:hypothetical protein
MSHKMRGTFRLADELLASGASLCLIQLFSSSAHGASNSKWQYVKGNVKGSGRGLGSGTVPAHARRVWGNLRLSEYNKYSKRDLNPDLPSQATGCYPHDVIRESGSHFPQIPHFFQQAKCSVIKVKLNCKLRHESPDELYPRERHLGILV